MNSRKLLSKEVANERAAGSTAAPAQDLATTIHPHTTAPLSRSLSSSATPSPGDLLTLQRTLGNRRVRELMQRAEAEGTQSDASLPAGATANIEFHFDPVPEELSTGIAGAIPLQSAQSGTAGAVIAQSLTWDDFPPVKNRIGGMSAQTGLNATWKDDGTNFNVTFNKRTSWSVKADQTPDLLRHEQFHLNLGVLVANQANAASGSTKPKALVAAFKHTLRAYTEQYDYDTQHGTNAAQQAAWEGNITSGNLAFPAP